MVICGVWDMSCKPCLLSLPEGVVEVWLTSEDLGAYGKDIGVTLPELLWQLIPIIPEPCMVRLGMTNPPYIMEHIEVGCMVVTRWSHGGHMMVTWWSHDGHMAVT